MTPPRASADPARTLWPTLFASQLEEWATPPEVVAGLAAEFGPFELDPAATAANAKAPAFYTLEHDGLAQPWAGARVWLNPPYGRAIGKWMRKALDEGRRGARVTCLVHARTDTAWWHDTVEAGATLVRFLRRRVRFIGPDGERHGAPFPSVVVLFGAFPAGPGWCRVSREPAPARCECEPLVMVCRRCLEGGAEC